MSETRLERLADLCEIVVGRTPSRSEPAFWGQGHPWVSIADMNQGLLISKTKEELTDLGAEKGKLVPQGTVLLSFKLSIGKVSIAGMPLYTNEAIAALIIKDPDVLDSRYLMWTLKSMDLSTGSNRAAMGATLNKAKLNEIRVPVPSLEEQKRKAQIKDIQSLIEQKRKHQQTLFEELKSATFREMFLDKSFPNKKLFEVANTSSGATPNRSNKNFYKDGEVPWVKSGELHQELIKNTSENITFEALEKTSVQLLPAGTVLIAMYGATVGAVSQLGIDATINQAVCAIQIKDPRITETYLKYYLRSQYNFILTQAAGGAQSNINQGIIKNLTIPIPPLNEQIKFSEILEIYQTSASK